MSLYVLDSGVYDSLFNELKCSICLGLFDEPVSTKCGHFFCSPCIQNYLREITKTVFLCPICKTQTNKRDLKSEKKIKNIVECFNEIRKKTSEPLKSTISKRKMHQEAGKTVNMQKMGVELEKRVESASKRRENSQTKSKNKLLRTFEQFKQAHLPLKKVPFTPQKQIKLLATGLPPEIMNELHKFSRLFRVKLYKHYTQKITHLIVYPLEDRADTIQAKRTLKYIHALIDGIWVLSYRWIFDCILSLTIKNEADYEVTEDSYFKSGAKTSRQKDGLHELFKDFVFFIKSNTEKSEKAFDLDDLREIIEKTGGKTSQNPEEAVVQLEITIDEPENQLKRKGSKIYSHKWLLDSISSAEIRDLAPYRV